MKVLTIDKRMLQNSRQCRSRCFRTLDSPAKIPRGLMLLYRSETFLSVYRGVETLPRTAPVSSSLRGARSSRNVSRKSAPNNAEISSALLAVRIRDTALKADA